MNAGNYRMNEPASAEQDEVMSDHIAGLRYAGMIQHYAQTGIIERLPE
jgi:hypothetical protein